MVEQPTGITFEQAEQIILLLTNLNNGVQFLMLCVGAFFVWQVVKIIYNLFAGVFFGGL